MVEGAEKLAFHAIWLGLKDHARDKACGEIYFDERLLDLDQ